MMIGPWYFGVLIKDRLSVFLAKIFSYSYSVFPMLLTIEPDFTIRQSDWQYKDYTVGSQTPLC